MGAFAAAEVMFEIVAINKFGSTREEPGTVFTRSSTGITHMGYKQAACRTCVRCMPVPISLIARNDTEALVRQTSKAPILRIFRVR